MLDLKIFKNHLQATWIVAILHLVLAPILAGVALFYLCISDYRRRDIFDDYDKKRSMYLARLWLGLVYCILIFAATITMIVGIKQKRYKLFWPFVIAIGSKSFMWFFVCAARIYGGAKGEEPFGDIVLSIFIIILIGVFQGICSIPVRKLRNTIKGDVCINYEEDLAELRRELAEARGGLSDAGELVGEIKRNQLYK